MSLGLSPSYLVTSDDPSRRGLDDILAGHTIGALYDMQPLLGHIEHAEVGYDTVDYTLAGERQSAFFKYFAVAMLVGVIHDNDDATDTSDQIHCSAHTLDQLAEMGCVLSSGDVKWLPCPPQPVLL